MADKSDLISLIKNGTWQQVSCGVNLLGEPMLERGFVPATFATLDEFCGNHGIPREDLFAAVRKYGSPSLIFEALQKTKDIDAFGKAWFNASKDARDAKLKQLVMLGASQAQLMDIEASVSLVGQPNGTSSMSVNLFDTEEDVVKFYLLGDKKRLWRYIKATRVQPQKHGSLVASAFASKGIDVYKYPEVINQIDNAKIFLDLCWGIVGKPKKEKLEEVSEDKPFTKWDEELIKKSKNDCNKDVLFKGLELLATFYTKFSDYALADDFLDVQFRFIKLFSYSSRKLKQYDNKSVNDMLGERLYNLYKAVFESKIPVIKKINFALHNCFRGKDNDWSLDCKKLLHLGDLENDIKILAKEYLEYLGRQTGISSNNKQNYNALGYIEYEDVQRLNNGTLRDFHNNSKSVIISTCFNLVKEGYLQEYVKFIYCNFSSALNRYRENNLPDFSFDEIIQIEQKYVQTASYKAMPVPFEYLWTKEVMCKNVPKYPFFILARNAAKQPKFKEEMLGERIFYEDGFNGKLFEEKNNQWKAEREDSQIFTSYPQSGIDLSSLYKQCSMSEIEKQRRQFNQKYFGEDTLGAQNCTENIDDSLQAAACENSLSLLDYDWQADPEVAAFETEIFATRTAEEELDVPELTDFDLDEYGDEREWNVEDMQTDPEWSYEQDYMHLERLIENDWQEFISIVTGKPKKEITYIACGVEYGEDNRPINNRIELEFDDECEIAHQTKKEDYENEVEKIEKAEVKKLKFANKVIAARNYLINNFIRQGLSEEEAEEQLRYSDGKPLSDKNILSRAKFEMQLEQEAYTDDMIEEDEENLWQDEKEYQPDEPTCYDNILEEAAIEDAMASENISGYDEWKYGCIEEAIKEEIQNGNVEAADKDMFEQNGEAESCFKLELNAEGLTFFRNQYRINHQNWNIPIEPYEDEDSPDNEEFIPF